MSYENDIFISYRRRGNIENWINFHFKPCLKEALFNHMPEDPKIWIDLEQEDGIDWRENLSRGLSRSKLLLAVWSPDYFRSNWCMAEWGTMKERQKLVVQKGGEMPPALIYPIKFSDGINYHPDAKRIECKKDFSNLNYPYETFKDSPRYLEFHDNVNEIAQDLTIWLAQVPDWQDNWPLEELDPMPDMVQPRPEI